MFSVCSQRCTRHDCQGDRCGQSRFQAFEMSKRTPLDLGVVQESEIPAGKSTNQKMGGELCSHALIGSVVCGVGFAFMASLHYHHGLICLRRFQSRKFEPNSLVTSAVHHSLAKARCVVGLCYLSLLDRSTGHVLQGLAIISQLLTEGNFRQGAARRRLVSFFNGCSGVDNCCSNVIYFAGAVVKSLVICDSQYCWLAFLC